jgi:hypothetical protein
MEKKIKQRVKDFIAKYDGDINKLKRDFDEKKVSGSSRDVYLVDDAFVAKVQNGLNVSYKQNSKELQVWMNAKEKEKEYLAEIFGTCCNEDVIIMQRAEEISHIAEIKDIDEATRLAINHKLSLEDVFKLSSWGRVAECSHPVLIDYGCDDETLADLTMDNTYEDEEAFEEDEYWDDDGIEVTSFDERKHSSKE